MNTILTTEIFNEWLNNLKNLKAKANILARIDRLKLGNFGDIKPVGEGVSELRINTGKGYRVYLFQKCKNEIIILLCGGDKSTQDKDIKKAKELKKKLKEIKK